MTHKQLAQWLHLHAERIEAQSFQILNTGADLKDVVDQTYAELTRTMALVQAFDVQEVMAHYKEG